jgi:hypothetical protein
VVTLREVEIAGGKGELYAHITLTEDAASADSAGGASSLKMRRLRLRSSDPGSFATSPGGPVAASGADGSQAAATTRVTSSAAAAAAAASHDNDAAFETLASGKSTLFAVPAESQDTDNTIVSLVIHTN